MKDNKLKEKLNVFLNELDAKTHGSTGRQLFASIDSGERTADQVLRLIKGISINEYGSTPTHN